MTASDMPERDGSENGAPKGDAALTGPAAHAAPTKVDPESLVLRGSPRRVVRFRRELIIGVAAAGALAIAATAWIALRPASFKLAAPVDEMFEAKGVRSPEVLAAAPGSYDAIPKLGPPLPGDLGRPILAHRRRLAGEGELPPVDSGADAATAARERALADQAAARQSAVLLLGGRGDAADRAATGAGLAEGRPNEAVPGTSDRPAATGSPVAAGTNEVSAHRIRPPASP